MTMTLTQAAPVPSISVPSAVPSPAAVLSPAAVPSASTVLPADVLPRRPAEALLAAARSGLSEAVLACPTGPQDTRTAARRYAAAHLAALRTAAAVLAARARPGPGRSRPTSVWVLLTRVAPEMGEWAAFFAAGAAKRSAAEAGLPTAVTVREADDLLRDAQSFLSLVESTLYGSCQEPLALSGQR